MFGSGAVPGRRAEPAPKAGPLRTMVAISSGTPSAPEGCGPEPVSSPESGFFGSSAPGLGTALLEKANMWFIRPETREDNPETARPGTGPSAASLAKGSSLCCRIERAFLNIPGFPSNSGFGRGKPQPQWGAGLGRKALLVLLYPTGWLLGRPTCGSGLWPASGMETPVGRTSRGRGVFRAGTVIATPPKPVLGA